MKAELLDSKEKLRIWIQKDRVSCGFAARESVKEKLIGILAPNYILCFLKTLRKVEYLTNSKQVICRPLRLLSNRIRLRRIQIKCGYTIPINVFGPGLSIAHYGTIVVSQYARIGCNCRLHVGVNIGASGGNNKAPQIGDNVYIGPGAIIYGDISIADESTIGANATVNSSFLTSNTMIAGTPARIVKYDVPAWKKIIKV